MFYILNGMLPVVEGPSILSSMGRREEGRGEG